MLASTVQFSSYGRPRHHATAYQPPTATRTPTARPKTDRHDDGQRWCQRFDAATVHRADPRPTPGPPVSTRHTTAAHTPHHQQERTRRSEHLIPQDPTACFGTSPTPATRPNLTPPKGRPHHHHQPSIKDDRPAATPKGA